MTESEVRSYFDASAGDYDCGYAASGSRGRTLRRRAELAAALLGAGPGDVLDAGMGGGVLLEELDRRGWRVAGVDLAPSMVERARGRLPHARERLLEGSIEDLPFADGSFDAVVATGVLEYAAHDLDRAVTELVRVLRPGGTLVASFPNYRAPATLWRAHVQYPLVRAVKRRVRTRRPPPPQMPLVPCSRFREALDGAGVRLDSVEPVGVRPLPARLARRLERGRSALAFRLAVQYVLRGRKEGS